MATLVAPGGALAGNEYAKAVLNKGESAAQTSLRQEVKQIFDNSEKLIDFSEKK